LIGSVAAKGAPGFGSILDREADYSGVDRATPPNIAARVQEAAALCFPRN
jgi:hypothetical protein